MKILITLVCLILLIPALSSQTMLKGKVVILNSGKKPLSGVQITVNNGEKIVYSAADGRFNISFPDKSKGDYIGIAASLPDYKVVNEASLMSIGINPDKEIVVEMCKPELLARRRDAFYSLHLYPLVKKIQEESKQAKKDADKEIARLNYRLAALEGLSDWFINFNPDYADNLEKELFRMLEEGQTGLILSSDLTARIENEIKRNLKGKEFGAKATDQVTRLLENLERIAEISMIEGDFNKFKENYQKIIAFEADDFNWTYKYASKLQQLLELDNSIEMYEKAIATAKSNPDSIRGMNAMAYIYLVIDKIELAKKYFLRAEKTDKGLNIGYSISTVNGLLRVFRRKMDFDTTGYYEKKLMNYLSLNLNNRDFRKSAARAYSDLGDYYYDRYLYGRGDFLYSNSDRIYKSIPTLDKEDPKYVVEMQREYAQFLGLLGEKSLNRKKSKASEEYYAQSDSILNGLIAHGDNFSAMIVFFNEFNKNFNDILLGNTRQGEKLKNKFDLLKSKLPAEAVSIASSLMDLLSNLHEYASSSNLGFSNFDIDSLSVSTFEAYGVKTVPIFLKISALGNFRDPHKDSLAQLEELQRITTFVVDSLSQTEILKKSELCQMLVMLSQTWFGVGATKPGFNCLVKAYEIGKKIAESDQTGFSFYPELGNIYFNFSLCFFTAEMIPESIMATDSAIAIYEKMLQIDTAQFACRLAESYLQKMNLLQTVQNRLVLNGDWYDYIISDSLNRYLARLDGVVKYCHDDMLGNESFLNYQFLNQKALVAIRTAYATGVFTSREQSSLDTIKSIAAGFNDADLPDQLRASTIVEFITDFQNTVTPETLEKARIYFSSKKQIDASIAEQDPYRQVRLLLSLEDYLNGSLKKYPQDELLKKRLALVYNNLSWNYLFLKEFKKSETNAKKSLKIDSSEENLVPYTNLGHAYLFRGKLKNAIATYENLKNKSDDNDIPYKKILISDFTELGNAGILHPDVQKAKGVIESW